MAITKKLIRLSSKNGIYYCHSITDYQGTSLPYQRTATQIHSACEVLLVLSGSLTYVIEGQKYALKENQVIIVPPHTTHYTLVDTSKPFERAVLEYLPDLLPALVDCDLSEPFKKAKLFSYTINEEFTEKANLKKILLDFGKLCRRTDKYRDVDISRQIIRLAKHMHLITDELIKSTKESKHIQTNSVSQLCIQYIAAHIEQNISVKDLADALHISPSHILHQFKQELGITLHRYISKQKMEMAYRLLQKGISVNAVASQLGYDYYSTFFHNYVKFWGITPSTTLERSVAQIERNSRTES